MKTLYLVRHAKSSWDDDSLKDHDRPLSKRGLRAAPEMGQRLQVADVRIDLIISSSANRALTTAGCLATAIGYAAADIEQDTELYFEGCDAMLATLNRVDDKVKTLMLVGHNPDMTDFLNRLCGDRVENMPTCAIATLQFNQPWSAVSYQSGLLLDYDFPKNSRHL